MTAEIIFGLYIFIFAFFCGVEFSSNIPGGLRAGRTAILNALSGITIIAALSSASSTSRVANFVAHIATVAAASVLVSGFIAARRSFRSPSG